MPERIFTKVPVLANTIPARYAVYTVLMAALLLALILDHLHAVAGGRRLHRHRSGAGRHRRLLALVVPLAVAVVALLPLYPVTPMRQIRPLDIPAYFTSAGAGGHPDGKRGHAVPVPFEYHAQRSGLAGRGQAARS